MTALPLKTSISAPYPNPSNAEARAAFAKLWDVLNEEIEAPELDIASATTCDIGGQLSTKLRITGTTTITSFGTNFRGPILLRMAGALTITHNSTTLVCPGSASITTTAGDVLVAWPKSTASGTADGWQVARIGYKNATASAAGVAPLATGPEAQAGVDNTKIITPAALGITVLGMGQTWQGMSASRALNTNYTNTTGRSIIVSVAALLSTAYATLAVNINGSAVGFSSGNFATNGWCAAQPILVPPGATYSVTINGGGSASSLSWLELR